MGQGKEIVRSVRRKRVNGGDTIGQQLVAPDTAGRQGAKAGEEPSCSVNYLFMAWGFSRRKLKLGEF